jgi:hypothetical protein
MIMYLYKSNKANKKWAAFFPAKKKVIHFGQKPYRDFTLVSSKQSVHYIKNRKEREAVKTAYQARHKNDNLDDPESAGALSWHILWTASTLKGGIRNYAKTFSYKVVDKTVTKYSQEEAKKLI